MTSSGAAAIDTRNMVQDAVNSLLSMDMPVDYPDDDEPELTFDDDWQGTAAKPEPVKQRDYAIANWLDALEALTGKVEPAISAEGPKKHIASVNSDDAGLYRLFASATS